MEVQLGMKLTNIGSVFAMIFICFAVMLDHRMEIVNRTLKLQHEYNQGVDNSLEAAMDRLVEVDDSLRARINKEEAVEIFFRNLSIHFQVIENKQLTHTLKGHVPLIAIILEDGFYIYYDKEVYSNGTKILQKTFTEKAPYLYEEGEYTYFFTLTDYIRIWDGKSGKKVQGRYKDIVMNGEVDIQNRILRNEDEFHRVRRDTIINKLEETIEYYINNHNKISSHYGINYEFTLPTIEEEDWYRTINDISMIAFMQGYPHKNQLTGTYNHYAIAGARLHK